MKKECIKCKEIKPVEEFYRNKITLYMSQCKDCCKKYDALRNKQPERIKYKEKQSKKWRANNPEKVAEYNLVKKANWIRNEDPMNSRGEQAIEKYLIDKGIQYIREVSHPNCNSLKGHPLHFDFFLPKNGAIIEYQGSQHFLSNGV